ncbi:MAG: M48 family metallopeptidase [Pirellulaceae bacterium]|nr:M48 family metallopeptidase [Pirellulaceae bacterium]
MSQGANKANRKELVDKLLKASQQPIPPVERSPKFQSELTISLVVMYLMIGGYVLLLVGMMGAALGCVATGIMSRNPFLMLFAGCSGFGLFCLLLALIKPLLAPPTQLLDPFQLNPQHEPVLFQFVANVCKSVGATAPGKILVSHDVNAAASFEKGASGPLELTIGLPLVAGINTRQFAGIIAHEFGHFNQEVGMKRSYKIRNIIQWFGTAAFERDSWDEKLAAWSENSPAGVVFYVLRAGIFGARLLLMGITMGGVFFVSRLLREMEFDADRVEARFAGSQNFAKTCRQLRLLGICSEIAHEELDRYRREQRLPDNLPKMIVSKVSEIDKKKFQELERELLNAKTEWHDTHPSDRERIDNAVREGAPGVFQLEYPTSLLFTDLNGLCRAETIRLYRHSFETEFNPNAIKATDELVARAKVEATEADAAMRFVLHQFCGFRTFQLPRFSLGEPIATAQFKQNTELRRKLLIRDVVGYHMMKKQEATLEEERSKAVAARRMIEAGLNLQGQDVVYPAVSIIDANTRVATLSRQLDDLKLKLTPFRQMLGTRLIDALEFLRSPKVCERIGEPTTVAQEANSILKVLERIEACRDTLNDFAMDLAVTVLLGGILSDSSDPQLFGSFQAAVFRVHSQISHIQQSTWQVECPFEHGKGKVSVAYFLLDHLPAPRDPAAILNAAVDFDSNMDTLLIRSLARLGALAEKIEAVFGFPALAAPPEVVDND